MDVSACFGTQSTSCLALKNTIASQIVKLLHRPRRKEGISSMHKVGSSRPSAHRPESCTTSNVDFSACFATSNEDARAEVTAYEVPPLQ